jgi:hypothetical protein
MLFTQLRDIAPAAVLCRLRKVELERTSDERRTVGDHSMTRKLFLMLSAAATSMIPTGGAAGPQSEIIAAYQALQRGNDLSAIERLRQLAATSRNEDTVEAAESAIVQYGPRLDGRVVVSPHHTGAEAQPQDVVAARAAERRSAIRAIVDMARGRRIVILNETHADPEHRAFALSVLAALRPAGFSKLAVEALLNDGDPASTDVEGLRTRGYPVRESGGYLGDPVFADMLRQGLALGYEPVAYEQTVDQRRRDGGGIDAREEAQADNLANLLDKDPEARVVVYVGFRHAAKFPLTSDGVSRRWMAARLWEKMGSEPLTIDQTGLASTVRDRAAATLRDVVRARGITQPTILYADGKPLLFGAWRGTVDAQVIHPATIVAHGRPTWLAAMGRHVVQPDRALIPASGRALVQARLEDEGDDAVPIDQVVLSGRNSPWFMLPDKPVRFVVKEVVR